MDINLKTIRLSKKQIESYIKKYYKDKYQIKNCKISFSYIKPDIDKMKQCDSWNTNNEFYVIPFGLEVTNEIPVKDKIYARYIETLHEKEVKDIITTTLNDEVKNKGIYFNIKAFNLKYKPINDTWEALIDIENTYTFRLSDKYYNKKFYVKNK